MREHISYSEISRWLHCETEWYWAYGRKIEPILRSVALDTGSFFHAVAKHEDWGNVEKILQHVVPDNIADPDKRYRVRSAAAKALDICREYSNFRLAHPLNIFATEVPCSINCGGHNLLSIADAMVDHDGATWLLEYKTGNPNVEFLALYDLQSAIECAVFDAAGTIYEVINSSTRNITIDRVFIERTPKEKDHAMLEAFLAAEETSYRDKPVAMSRSRDCVWCGYNTLCLAEITGGDTKVIIDNYYTPKTHREEV